jgi:hypothetical protein
VATTRQPPPHPTAPGRAAAGSHNRTHHLTPHAADHPRAGRHAFPHVAAATADGCIGLDEAADSEQADDDGQRRDIVGGDLRLAAISVDENTRPLVDTGG